MLTIAIGAKRTVAHRVIGHVRRYALVLLITNVAAFGQTVGAVGAWVTVKMRWEHAPRYVNPKLETASTAVLYFDANQHFANVGCVVDREPGRYITISAGDGQLVSYGNWDGHLPEKVRYRLISRTVPRLGEMLPGPWQSELVISNRKGYLLFKGELYRKSKRP